MNSSLDSRDYVSPDDYRSSPPSSNNNNYSPDQVNSWQQWKEAKTTTDQPSVVYVNPDFIQPQGAIFMDEVEMLSPASPEPVARKGPKTPPEPEDLTQSPHVQVFLEKESNEPSPEPLGRKESTLIRISIDEEEEEEREAGELEPEEEDQIQETAETLQEKSKETRPKKNEDLGKTSEQKKMISTSPREKKRRYRSRSRERGAKRTSRSRSQLKRPEKNNKRSRSSSRDTFDGITTPAHQSSAEHIRCNQCSRLFASAHDVAVHEIRSHDTRIPCAICAKVLLSPARLVNHTEKHHSSEKVRCRFCDEKFGSRANALSHADWNDFREHIFREILRRKIKDYSNRCPDTVALRGVGRCPHGPAIKCRNFPKCPGSRCIYSHGRCDFSDTCTNSDCPFDHPNRPRVCMACVKDLKTRRRTRSPPSRSRD